MTTFCSKGGPKVRLENVHLLCSVAYKKKLQWTNKQVQKYNWTTHTCSDTKNGLAQCSIVPVG